MTIPSNALTHQVKIISIFRLVGRVVIMKKIFIVSLIFLAITLFFLGVYNFAFKKNEPVVQVPKATTQAIEQPLINKQKIIQISKDPVLSPVFDKKTGMIKYYSATDGTVWQVDADGENKTQISSAALPGLKEVKWSPDSSRVLTHFVKEGKDVFYEYDYNKKAGLQLKDGLDAASWDNLGAKIIYKYYDAKSGKRTLNLANPDGSGWQTIAADVVPRDVSIATIPLTSLVSFWNSPKATEESKLQTVGVVGGEVKSVLSGKFGADYLWSQDGSQALVSSVSGNAMMLGLVDLTGKYRDLNISTMVSKCAWSKDNKTIYCALPTNIPAGATMPDDYASGKLNTQDTFWKIDTATAVKTQIVQTKEMTTSLDASNMLLSPTEDSVLFVNRADRGLYRLEL